MQKRPCHYPSSERSNAYLIPREEKLCEARKFAIILFLRLSVISILRDLLDIVKYTVNWLHYPPALQIR
jgi:hypothetical protein